MQELRIPENRFRELRQVQESGRSNMFDRVGVIQAANQLHLAQLASFLSIHSDRYGQILVQFSKWLKEQR